MAANYIPNIWAVGVGVFAQQVSSVDQRYNLFGFVRLQRNNLFVFVGNIPRSTHIRISVLSCVTSGVFKASKDAPIPCELCICGRLITGETQVWATCVTAC